VLRWVYDHMRVQGYPAVDIDLTERIAELVDWTRCCLLTDLERENRRLPGELLRTREEIADLKERLAYALQQVHELSSMVPRRELHST
jgi:hypothetical protein